MELLEIHKIKNGQVTNVDSDLRKIWAKEGKVQQVINPPTVRSLNHAA